jgi:putative transposase
VVKKRLLISPTNLLPIQRQCLLLGLPRSTFYHDAKGLDDTYLSNEIMDIWMSYPFFGYRRITDELQDNNILVNHKCVLRLMKMMHIRSALPRQKILTTIPNPMNAVRPYLLKDLIINAANQVWAVDITYIKLPTGMVYLFALIDWHTRFVVGWKLANTMEAYHATEVLNLAIGMYGKPIIANADQGSQFTGVDWIQTCESNGIKVSHDGVGRCIDNIRIERLWWSIKYEHVHLYSHQTMGELEAGLAQYIHFYNNKRRHQALGKKRPADLYFAA